MVFVGRAHHPPSLRARGLLDLFVVVFVFFFVKNSFFLCVAFPFVLLCVFFLRQFLLCLSFLGPLKCITHPKPKTCKNCRRRDFLI